MTDQYNFPFSVTTLTGSDFHLEPFDTPKHATAYYAATGSTPDLYTYMSIGPYETEQAFINDLVNSRASSPTHQLYAIMTTRQPKSQSSPSPNPALAGLIGLCAASATHLKVEIGPIILIPAYQGVGLAVSVCDLVIRHALTPEADGGWGLRRVQWLCHAGNEASVRLAEKLGMRREGVVRWEMVFRDGVNRKKVGNGRGCPPGGREGDLGRDSVCFARCWDD